MDDSRTTTHPQDMPPARSVPVLHGVRGGCAGELFELTARQAVVGKSDAADIRVRDTGVSRQHAKIVVAADRTVTVMDLASRNGTFVNGTRIEVAAIRDGDVVRFGPSACVRLAYREQKAAAKAADGRAVELSARQLEVARRAADGLTNDEIAAALGISPRTVKSHLDQIYRRLGVGSRAALTRWLAHEGLLVSKDE